MKFLPKEATTTRLTATTTTVTTTKTNESASPYSFREFHCLASYWLLNEFSSPDERNVVFSPSFQERTSCSCLRSGVFVGIFLGHTSWLRLVSNCFAKAGKTCAISRSRYDEVIVTKFKSSFYNV